MNRKALALLVVINIFGHYVYGVEEQDPLVADEEKLVESLLANSDLRKVTRPAKNNSVITVHFGLELLKLLNVDESEHRIELQVWTKKTWKDFRLSWDPDKHGGIQTIHLPHDRIWLPDVILYNGAFQSGESSGYGHIYDALVVVNNDGSLLWITPARLNAFCDIDMKDFPFDTQTCKLTFGSWTYSGAKVDVQLHLDFQKVSLDYYKKSMEWEVVDTSATRSDVYYPCCPESYPNIAFTLKIKRLRTFYTYMLVLPGIALCFLIPCVFLIPLQRPEKFYLGGVLLFCLLILTVLLQLMIPTLHGSVPSIEMYYLTSLMFTALSLALSSILLRISTVCSQPPTFVTKLIRVLSKCCCMPGSQGNQGFKVMMQNQDENPIVMDSDSTTMTQPKCEIGSEWLQLGWLLDRFFCVIFVIISIINTITMCSRM